MVSTVPGDDSELAEESRERGLSKIKALALSDLLCWWTPTWSSRMAGGFTAPWASLYAGRSLLAHDSKTSRLSFGVLASQTRQRSETPLFVATDVVLQSFVIAWVREVVGTDAIVVRSCSLSATVLRVV